MKILALSTTLILSVATIGTAEDRGHSLASAKPAANSSDFHNMLSSLSNMLSSTNPKMVAQNAEPAAGETAAPQAVSDVDDLPPLPGAAVKKVKEPRRIAQPEANTSALSPQTRSMLEAAPSGIGNRQNKAGGNISLKRGGFDPEYGQYIDGPIDQAEPPAAPVNPDKIAKDGSKVKPDIKLAARPGKMDIKVVSVSNVNDTLINYLEQGFKALNTGQYEGAVALYKSALLKDPRNRDAMFGIATAYQKGGQKTQARNAYSALLAAYPAYEPGLNNLLVMASNESPKDALKELDALGARNPNFAAVYAQKAAIYGKMGDNISAKRNLVKALSLEPGNIVYRYNLAILVDKMGEIDVATKLYGQLLDQSAKGIALPVERSEISDRLTYIAAQHKNL